MLLGVIPIPPTGGEAVSPPTGGNLALGVDSSLPLTPYPLLSLKRLPLLESPAYYFGRVGYYHESPGIMA